MPAPSFPCGGARFCARSEPLSTGSKQVSGEELDKRAFWDRKILGWEQSRYEESRANHGLLERLAGRASDSLRFRITKSLELVAPYIAGRDIFEIGCGSGRIAIPMAMSGLNVTGLDNSKEMLNLCRIKKRKIGKTSGRLRLLNRDMSDFDLGKRFDYIIMPYRTFMHMLTQAEQRSCLATVKNHLAPGGTFILDTWLPKPSSLNSLHGLGSIKPAGRFSIPGTPFNLVHYHCASFDESRQLLLEEHMMQEVDEDGTVLRTVTLPLVRTWTTQREMQNLVQLCDFEVEAIFGDFDCNPIDESSRNMIWILKST